MPAQSVTQGGAAPAAALAAALQDRAPRVAIAIAAGQALAPAARRIRGRLAQSRSYTVKATGEDVMFDELHEWVLSLLPPGDRRALVAWSQRRGEGVPIASPNAAPASPQLRLRYDGSRHVLPLGRPAAPHGRRRR